MDNYLAGEDLGVTATLLLRPLVSLLKRWDYAAAQRVTHFIAISRAVKERISRFYKRESTIIFPPVETARFDSIASEDVEDYYLVVSRLIPYKRIDLAIQAATELGVEAEDRRRRTRHEAAARAGGR